MGLMSSQVGRQCQWCTPHSRPRLVWHTVVGYGIRIHIPCSGAQLQGLSRKRDRVLGGKGTAAHSSMYPRGVWGNVPCRVVCVWGGRGGRCRLSIEGSGCMPCYPPPPWASIVGRTCTARQSMAGQGSSLQLQASQHPGEFSLVCLKAVGVTAHICTPCFCQTEGRLPGQCSACSDKELPNLALLYPAMLGPTC